MSKCGRYVLRNSARLSRAFPRRWESAPSSLKAEKRFEDSCANLMPLTGPSISRNLAGGEPILECHSRRHGTHDWRHDHSATSIAAGVTGSLLVALGCEVGRGRQTG